MRREEPTSHGVSTANADAAKVGCFCGRPRASERSMPTGLLRAVHTSPPA